MKIKYLFKYYKIYKRKERIRKIKFERRFKESILGMWAYHKKVEMPLLELSIKKDLEVLFNESDTITYKMPEWKINTL